VSAQYRLKYLREHPGQLRKGIFPMDESSVTSANLDQTGQDFLALEVPDEIVEAAAEALNICRMTFGGWPSTTAAYCNPG